MKLPREVPVMILPNVTLFPQAPLPLYIFEPRYRQMLADTLHSQRMFCMAMQRPGTSREIPEPIAGLGLVRVCVTHGDGTSHLILQGLSRVELGPVVKYKPYRIQKIQPLPTPPSDSAAVDALMARMRELLQQRLKLGPPFPFPPFSNPAPGQADIQENPTLQQVFGYLENVNDAAQAVDLVSWHMLEGSAERQKILETLDVESRLRRLIGFLIREIRNHPKDKP